MYICIWKGRKQLAKGYKNISMKKILILASSILLLTSCDKHAECHFKVRNELSDKAIKINTWSKSSLTNYDVPINTEVEIYQGLGGLNKGADDCFIIFYGAFDSINIYKVDNSNLVKSNKYFIKETEWDFSKNGEWVGNYILSIDTTDF